MENDNRETDKILTNLHTVAYLYIVASIVIFIVLLSKFFSSFLFIPLLTVLQITTKHKLQLKYEIKYDP